MSAFAMILAAGMTVGNGPERVSGDVKLTPLEMSGRWEGTFLFVGIKWKAEIADGNCRKYHQGKIIAVSKWAVVDEGGGRFRLNGNKPCWGIYKASGDRVTICFNEIPNPRPTTFRVTNHQAMYILHRVKPRK